VDILSGMKFIRSNGGFAVVAVGGLASIITIVAFAVPTLRDWLAGHGEVAWLLLICSFVLFAFMLKVQWSRDDTIAELESKLKSTKEALVSAKEVPTPRDIELAKAVMSIWEPNGDLCRYFTTNFTAKIWIEDSVETLYSFVSQYENHFFDNHVVNQAFKELLGGANQLTFWLSMESAASNENNQHPAKDQPFVYTVREFSAFPSATEYNEMRQEGMGLAKSVCSASLEFAVVAREHKL